MKTRPNVIWSCAAALALAAILILISKKRAGEALPLGSESNVSVVPKVQTSNESRNPMTTSTTPTNAASSTNATEPVEGIKSKDEQMREGLAALNNDDIIFYGRVIDQFGAPVADATVSGVIQVNNGSRVGTDRVSTSTDGSGHFTISGYKGKNLGIHIAKPGYSLATTGTSFVYSHLWPEPQRHIPDSNNPIAFKMWKLQGAEPLADISQTYKPPFTNTPFSLDFLKHEFVKSDGDLQVTVTRAAGSLSKTAGDWSAEFVPQDGGIIEVGNDVAAVTFEAPADGYQSSYLVEMKPDERGWSDGITKTFFMKSRGGQIYTKFRMVFGINREPNEKLWIDIRGVANTNGSRNWEATVPP